MSGTKQGGITARNTMKDLYGEDYFKLLGSKGGKKGKADGTIKGFALDNDRAREAGRKGGLKSKRGKSVNK